MSTPYSAYQDHQVKISLEGKPQGGVQRGGALFHWSKKMSEYTENARVVAVLPNPVRDRLFEAASEKGYSTSHLLRELVIKELDRLDAAKSKVAA